MALTFSLPFLVENGLDQLHSQGDLLWSKKQVQFPLYLWLAHARKSLSTTVPRNSITLEGSTVEVSSKNCQTIPLRTRKGFNAMVNGEAIVKKQADFVFSY